MMASLKSEFRKLLTVRSTYILTILVLAFIAFLSIYVFGYNQAAQQASSPVFMSDTIYTMLGTAVTFITIISILLIVHEYRYNTINYTLTLSPSRIRVLFSKTVVMLTYATVVGAAVVAIAYFGSKLGLSIKGAELAPQQLPLDLIWKYTAYVWGYALIGIILALLIRGVVGAIVAIFLIPTIEGLLSLLLKDNTKYLPFRALDGIPATAAPNSITSSVETLTSAAALGVFAVYLAIFGTIAVVSFLKRDAN